MVATYPFDAYTRVAFAPTVADISAPTLAELGRTITSDPYIDEYIDPYAGTVTWLFDIQCELTAGGLALSKSTSTVDATPWYGGLQQERPTRFAVDGASLEAFRLQAETGVLWEGCQFRAQRVLVVRRGIPVDQDWNTGDPVEVYRVTLGKRSTNRSARNTAVTFTVPLYVTAEDDDAVVA